MIYLKMTCQRKVTKPMMSDNWSDWEGRMYAVTLYGREVVVRSRVWFGPFHSRMYEVCDVSGGEPYTPIAVFDCVDDVWKYIAAEGHRVRNWKSWLLTTIDAYQQHREIEECLASWSTKLGENLQFRDL